MQNITEQGVANFLAARIAEASTNLQRLENACRAITGASYSPTIQAGTVNPKETPKRKTRRAYGSGKRAVVAYLKGASSPVKPSVIAKATKIADSTIGSTLRNLAAQKQVRLTKDGWTLINGTTH